MKNNSRNLLIHAIISSIIFLTISCWLLWTTWRSWRQVQINHQLIASIKNNDTVSIMRVLSMGADANARDNDCDENFLYFINNLLKGRSSDIYNRETALELAFISSEDFTHQRGVDYQIVNKLAIKALIENGADPNTRSLYNIPMLHFAVETNDTDLIKCFLDHHASVSALDSNHGTALMKTAKASTINLLLSYGADMEVEDDAGYTPMMYAVRYGDIKALQTYLDHGANVNHRNKDGDTTLSLPRRFLGIGQEKLLRKYGATE